MTDGNEVPVVAEAAALAGCSGYAILDKHLKFVGCCSV